jgi:hypothetical protein
MTGRTVTRQQLADCPDCLDWLGRNPHIVGACASVGIEHGKSTSRVVFEYTAAYHFRQHRDAA